MATEIIRVENCNLVRLRLVGEDGKTLLDAAGKPLYKDLDWPAAGGELLLNDGDGGIVGSGPLVDGLRPWARFPGKGYRVSQVQISTRPTDPAATDPAKMDKVTVLSYTP